MSDQLEVHIAEAHDGAILARFPFSVAGLEALKAARTADSWAEWLDEAGAWRVPRTLWRRAEQRLRARGYTIVPLSMPNTGREGVPRVLDAPR